MASIGTICIDKCPISAVAIRLSAEGRVEIINPAATGIGCTGCGVCQEVCPTTPRKAIRIIPNDGIRYNWRFAGRAKILFAPQSLVLAVVSKEDLCCT